MKTIEKWTNTELAAQCVMPRLSADEYFANPLYRSKAIELVNMGVVGFCVFKGTITQTIQMISELEMSAEEPLLFSADFEHGLLMRLDNGSPFPHAMAIAQSGNSTNAYEIGKSIAIEAKYLGVHWNLAPVADINSNPKNPIINIRSFGEDHKTVSEFADQYILGTQKENVIACAKHFPGHGDTDTDSHLKLPVLNKTFEELENNELKPFYTAIENGVKSIMLGHLLIPELDDKYPASLSKAIVSGLLREKMQYDGLIITDALDMNAITDNYGVNESAILALEAGANIALLPPDPIEAIKEIAKKAGQDKEFKSKLKDSIQKIHEAKKFTGIYTQVPGMEQRGTAHFEDHEKTALKVAYNALKYNKDTTHLPISEDDVFAAFGFIKNIEIEEASFFFKMLAQATENDLDFGFIDETIQDEDIESFKEGIADAKFLIFPIFAKVKAYSESIEFTQRLNDILSKIADGRPRIVILFGSPYIKNNLDAELVIDAFSDSMSSMAASIVALTGRSIENYQ